MGCGMWLDLITCIAAIITALATLAAVLVASSSLKNSLRSNLVIYPVATCVKDIHLYLVIKNFGNTGAYVSHFKSSEDLSKLKYDDDVVAFANIVGTYIAPKQSYLFQLDHTKLKTSADSKEYIFEKIKFNIKYYESKPKRKPYDKDYEAEFVVSLSQYKDTPFAYEYDEAFPLKSIAYSIQELTEKFL